MKNKFNTRPVYLALAVAMTVHADHMDGPFYGVHGSAVSAIQNIVENIPAHIATAKAAGVVPLLQRAVAMGVYKGDKNRDPAEQLKRMGVCPGYKKRGMFSSKCKCGMAKDSH